MPRGCALMRYDLAAGQVATVLTLADSFDPWQLRPMRDGHHVAIFGDRPTPAI